ncbi:MAG: HEPN domain-containing protein [Magnetococcales bacterium]|nr:HEPN domain-containing protein [Magnetococcales bacterium]NGZ06222.1 HEPN domain-containing protein [Magnetococcales bacterium]
MNGLDHAYALLDLARDDLKACRQMVQDRENFTDAIFGFHIQQAIEKSLKAWLAALGIEYPKTHSLHRLLILLEEAQAPMESCHWVEEFSPFAVQFRYEFDPWDEPLERSHTVRMTESLLDHVATQIQLFSIHK